MANIRYLDDGRSDGTVLGQSLSSLVGLWGVTPVVQPTSASQSAVATSTITAVSTATPITSGYGYSTTALASAMQTAVNDVITRTAAQTVLLNQMRSDLVSAGILKGS